MLECSFPCGRSPTRTYGGLVRPSTGAEPFLRLQRVFDLPRHSGAPLGGSLAAFLPNNRFLPGHLKLFSPTYDMGRECSAKLADSKVTFRSSECLQEHARVIERT